MQCETAVNFNVPLAQREKTAWNEREKERPQGKRLCWTFSEWVITSDDNLCGLQARLATYPAGVTTSLIHTNPHQILAPIFMYIYVCRWVYIEASVYSMAAAAGTLTPTICMLRAAWHVEA